MKNNHQDEEKETSSAMSPFIEYKTRSHVFETVSLLGSISFWVYVQSRTESGSSALISAGIVMSLCYTIDQFITAFFQHKCKRPQVLSHYVLGLSTHLTFAVSYLVDEGAFIKCWRPTFFGYYLWTNITMILRPKLFFPSFHTFYTIHHIIAFVITGLWQVVGELCSCKMESHSIRVLVLWLCSDAYVYIMYTYKAWNPSRVSESTTFLRLRIFVFFIDKTQKYGALIHGIVSTGGYSSLDLTMTITAVFLDIINIFFQLQSILHSMNENPSSFDTRAINAISSTDESDHRIVNGIDLDDLSFDIEQRI